MCKNHPLCLTLATTATLIFNCALALYIDTSVFDLRFLCYNQIISLAVLQNIFTLLNALAKIETWTKIKKKKILLNKGFSFMSTKPW